MTDFNIATGAEQPLNRVGIENTQVVGENQGVLVGVGTDADGNTALVRADAASDTQVQAVGALFQQEVIDLDTKVNAHPWDDVERQIYEENRTLVGDRGTVVRYGVEMVNDDDDTSFTPGDPVYLAPGGGYTQTEPSASGEVVQRVGVALTPDGDGRDRILLDIAPEYEVLA